jgi:heme exporter protein CcmD
MNFSTPYLVYILSAYGITFLSLCFFLILTYIQWKRLSSDET